MIYRDIISRAPWTIQLSGHALHRAYQKGIEFEQVVACIKGGRIQEFGKNYLKFMMSYKQGCVVCVGEHKELNKIKILTIEWGCP